MERGSSKHGPQLDEDMEREVQSHTRGGPAGSRANEWRDPEAFDDEQPEPSWLPEAARPDGAPAPLTGEELEARSRLGRLIPRSVLPADRDALLRAMDQTRVPPELWAKLKRLPAARSVERVPNGPLYRPAMLPKRAASKPQSRSIGAIREGSPVCVNAGRG